MRPQRRGAGDPIRWRGGRNRVRAGSAVTEVKQRWSRRRDALRARPIANRLYRAGVAVVGAVVLAVGVVAIPYPGPGWAIVFLGLAILATEFRSAQRALAYVRARYGAVMAWFNRQHIAVKGLGAVFTGVLVLATLWLFGAVGWMAGLVGIEWPGLDSPLASGS